MHACMHEEYRSSVGISPHECVSMVAQRMYCGMHSLEVCGFGRGEEMSREYLMISTKRQLLLELSLLLLSCIKV